VEKIEGSQGVEISEFIALRPAGRSRGLLVVPIRHVQGGGDSFEELEFVGTGNQLRVRQRLLHVTSSQSRCRTSFLHQTNVRNMMKKMEYDSEQASD
jgi:hypothetical protein